jgi:hypothetical protein
MGRGSKPEIGGFPFASSRVWFVYICRLLPLVPNNRRQSAGNKSTKTVGTEAMLGLENSYLVISRFNEYWKHCQRDFGDCVVQTFFRVLKLHFSCTSIYTNMKN